MLLFKMTDTHYKRRRTLSSWYRKKPKTSPSTEAKRPEVSGLLTIELLLISIYSKELQSIEVLLWLIITFCLRRSRSSIAAAFSTGLQIGILSKTKLMLPHLDPKGQLTWDYAQTNSLRSGSVNSAFLGFRLLSTHIVSSAFSHKQPPGEFRFIIQKHRFH